jgi:hypothetical protein
VAGELILIVDAVKTFAATVQQLCNELPSGDSV